jgi:release factor glutamine methyltransferase
LTVGEVVGRTAKYFAGTGSPSPRLDADLVIGHVLGIARIEVYAQYDRPLTSAELDAARALVARRGRREPVAYITGRRGFRRIDVEVTPDVLIPRPETEMLVEWIIEVAPEGATVLDWGTGSGAVALALSDERPDLVVTAIDRSADALAVARGNGVRLGLEVEWVPSDGFAALAGRRFDLIAANPPYLSEKDLAAAPPELAYEPRCRRDTDRRNRGGAGGYDRGAAHRWWVPLGRGPDRPGWNRSHRPWPGWLTPCYGSSGGVGVYPRTGTCNRPPQGAAR